MSMLVKPNIDCEQYHATLAVRDLSAAIDYYVQKLGFLLAFAEGQPPTFAGVNLGQVQTFLRDGEPSPQGCSVYFVVSDADQLFEFHRATGANIARPPEDQAYGLRDYTVRDLDGYCLTFGHRLPECD